LGLGDGTGTGSLPKERISALFGRSSFRSHDVAVVAQFCSYTAKNSGIFLFKHIAGKTFQQSTGRIAGNFVTLLLFLIWKENLEIAEQYRNFVKI
jgi:hypothetical protein